MPLPLEGLRLVDLTRQLPGPFCSMILADLGMDVITVAAPGDALGSGMTLVQRNKRSVTLNLKHDDGRGVFDRIVDGADAVLEGFRPGVAKRLGVDFERLRERNPRLVYCSISGFGQDGPYRDVVGHDLNYIGYAGLLAYNGRPGEMPVVPSVQIGDIGGGGLMAAVGILTALLARQTTGRGQFVDISMTDGAVAWNVFHSLLYFVQKSDPLRGDELLTGRYPFYAIYETKDGKFVTVGAVEGHFWRNLCERLGFPEYSEKQYAEGDELEQMFDRFRAAFREKTRAEWLEIMSGTDVCFGPVNEISDVERDPQIRHREMIVEMDDPRQGKLKLLGIPVKLSETPGSIRRPPPASGEHTDEILREVGYADHEIAAFHEQGLC